MKSICFVNWANETPFISTQPIVIGRHNNNTER